MDPTDNNNLQPPPNDELATLRARAEAAESGMSEVRAALAAARTAHLDAVRAANPHIPSELITGDTPEDVTASLTRARDILARYDAARTTNGHAVKVPAGSFAAPPADWSKLSPRELIHQGLQTRGATH